MKTKAILTIVLLALGLALGAHAADGEMKPDQMKADLIGQTMGGRESSWKFQSADQIKSLTVQKKSAAQDKHVYTVALQLQATNGAPRYSAEAQVVYTKSGSAWKVHHVGLLSLRQMK